MRQRTILLHCEQGLGDAIQFCRYATLLARRGASVILEVPSELKPLMETLDGPTKVLAAGEPIPPFDCHCSLMSLPRAFKTTLDGIPAEVPYLSAPPDRMAQWRNRLETGTALRLGLAWAGNPQSGLPNGGWIDRQRSMRFDQFAPLFEVKDCDFYSLQKGEAAAAQRLDSPWRQRVTDWSQKLGDFADTAALIANLDLVITVDTAVAHLAGALGKPVWLLNRYNTCWRWLLDREDSPWYPAMRVFRQDETRSWDSVIAQVRTELRRFACG